MTSYESRFGQKSEGDRVRELEKENTKLRAELRKEREREAEPSRE